MADVRLEDIADQDWQVKTGALGQVVTGDEELAQAILNILRTPLGTAPLRPDFGSDLFEAIDKPPAIAAGIAIQAAHLALARWEPRITVERVVPTFAEDGITVEVYWRPAGALGEAPTRTEVTL